MSFSHSVIAVPGTRERLMQAFLTVWEDVQVVGHPAEFWSYRELYKWCQSRSWALGAEAQGETYAIYKDGAWAAMIDFALELHRQNERLCYLSEAFGHAVVVAANGNEGLAELSVYENGYLRREIVRNAAGVSMRGTPIPAEQGLDLSGFYLKEQELIWQALGMRSFLYEPSGPFLGIHAHARPAPALPPTTIGRAPVAKDRWWKIW